MSTSVVSQEFSAPIVMRDSNSASGKAIVWPVEPMATVVNDEKSASGKSLVWSSTKAKLNNAPQSSAASTRANSPAGSSSAEEQEGYMSSPPSESCRDVSNEGSEKVGDLNARCGIRNTILTDLGVELKAENMPEAQMGAPGTPSTSAGSPYMSSVGSPYLVDHNNMGYTPTSAMCSSPMRLIGTRPPLACQDSAHGSRCFRASQDASQRTPPQSIQQRIKGGLIRSGDASQRMPPKLSAQRLAGSLRPRCGDASERSPASGPHPVAGGSWGAAAAAVAATRAAASMPPPPPVNAAPNSVAVSACPPSPASHVVTFAPVPVPAAEKMAPATAEQVPSSLIGESRMPGVEICSVDSVKCWLAGISNRSMPSNEELAERLMAALPETYDD